KQIYLYNLNESGTPGFEVINPIFIGPDYFIILSLILATGLALTLIFCSLWEYFSLKVIIIVIIIGLLIQSIFSFILLYISNIWLNPILWIYMMSLFSSIFKLAKNLNLKKGITYFFRLNSKTIIHAGISLILAGFLIYASFQDIFFIPGFILLLIGIIPSIIISFFPKKKEIKA
ncbi:MAG: hypothetical protein ACFFDF_10585, partial [Candidatus Odinarchaeota archaeon]